MPRSNDPHRRIGVFKTLDQVPDHHLLANHTPVYEGRDVWDEYIQAKLAHRSERVRREAKRVEESWKNHIERRGRHHALAQPVDVESWFSTLIEDMGLRRAYNPYWTRLEEFYDYLVWNINHPHVYHPPRMAAGQGGVVSDIWETKIEEGKK